MVPLLRTLPGGNTANVAELVYALDLGSSGVTLGSSSLPIRTTFQSLEFELGIGMMSLRVKSAKRSIWSVP